MADEHMKRPKDHNVRQLVNDLRDIALAYHGAGQLRARISGAVGQFLDAHKFEGRAAPADLDAEGLPPLPEPRAIRAGHGFPKVYALAYTADQVREYAIQAIAADRRAREDACGS